MNTSSGNNTTDYTKWSIDPASPPGFLQTPIQTGPPPQPSTLSRLIHEQRRIKRATGEHVELDELLERTHRDRARAAMSRPLRGLHELTNVSNARGDAKPVVMVWNPPTQEWVGVSPKDAISDRPLEECKTHARFSQDRVERMLEDKAVAEQVLWHAQLQGVAIIDWMKRD